MNHLTRKLAFSLLVSLVTLPAISHAYLLQGPAQEKPNVTLKVGDPAPAIQIKKWIKGTPVSTFKKGSVYVMEFWATWCGPCKTSIPHLTELAHKYQGKATFTGVSVFEDPEAKDESYMARVASFVKDMGTKMDYNVGADGLNSVMGKTWMEASGQEGIPTAFIIDQSGTVAWIGHPMGDLDEVLGQVVNHTFDLKAEQSKKAKAEAEAGKIQQAIAPLMEALEAKKYDVAASEAGKLMTQFPEKADDLAMAKYQFTMQYDEAAGYAYAKELASGRFKDKAEMLNDIAWTMIDDNTPIKRRDYATAVIISSRAANIKKMTDPFTLDTYAYALFKSGDPKGAFDIQTKAVNLAIQMGTKVPAKTLADMKTRLATIKAKLKS